MAASALDLQLVFPEFANTNAALVESRIAQAEARIDAAVWGARAADGVLYLAAHLLATSPYGQQARLSSKDGSSTYLVEYVRLQREVAAGFRVI